MTDDDIICNMGDTHPVFYDLDIVSTIVCSLIKFINMAGISRSFRDATHHRTTQFLTPLSLPPFNLDQDALPLLQALQLYNRGIGDDGMSTFAKALSTGKFHQMLHLCLGDNMISVEGLSSFLAVSCSLPLLEWLNLHKNQICDNGMVALCQALVRGSFPRLEKLSVDENDVGDLGMIALASVLNQASLKFTLLNLSGNRITCIGMMALMSVAIKSNCFINLKSLQMADNMIGDEGMSVLAKAMRTRSLPNLRFLGIVDNLCSELAFETVNDLANEIVSANLAPPSEED